jgi:plastocyanin/mono/diheme cytochrome c family protein
MEMSSRSAGLLAGGIITATVVGMVVLAVFGVASWGVAAGLIAAVVLTLALIYIFFGRLNNVQKTGYASLLGVVLLALFIPLFWLGQNNAQADAQSANYDLTLHRGAALYGTYCLSCHGSTGQGYSGPKLNGSTDVSKLTDDDLTRIISAGVPKTTDLSSLGNQGLAMPAWSELYGGPLTADDISYLVALIRSTDPTYLKNNHISDMTNGFTYVYGELTTQAQIDNYNKYLHPPAQFGTPVDMTNTNKVSMQIINTQNNPSGYDFQIINIKIKVGTTVTWTNISAAPHTVTSGQSGAPDGKFDSGQTHLISPGGGTFSFTFTTQGTFPYFCTLHPAMVAQIIVVP